eukprot:CAMPEP_0176390934 /NCGR_PEP_ID=MMETSP0126-20121128/39602_1 /TAXON_ID=141414 ORGANISM="Strombidinopsis acuminatum, Strain SPMC142" /NCGR_SAMPLE_ID=MMETSP0126 /ASSEMBLY_ACC=CAM_ASM_000229 /LENGTH=155 /DNA_ID=CAMNT_0017760703 /DNA_START=1087 /DNA_END=1555 /DNA_ORIENTATION=-
MIEALNMRLGYPGEMLSFEEITMRAITEKNMTVQELLAVPESDDWIYSTGKAYTSSSFVISALRASGLFEDVEINASEFTPKDVYQLQIFDTEYQRPEDCAEADASSPTASSLVSTACSCLATQPSHLTITCTKVAQQQDLGKKLLLEVSMKTDT